MPALVVPKSIVPKTANIDILKKSKITLPKLTNADKKTAINQPDKIDL